MEKVLILRLSSMGDVVLSTAALEVARLKPGATGAFVDWVVSSEFAPILEGHPTLRRVIPFDRKGGLGAWLALCRELFAEGYAEVIDLHSSQRTALARLLFFVWTRTRGGGPRHWRKLAKQRLRLYGMFWLKGAWPKSWNPTPLVERLARTAGGTGAERPDLSHLVDPAEAERLKASQISSGKPIYCMMPSARWPGKRWSPRRFFDVIQASSAFPIVLGTSADDGSVELVRLLERARIPHLVAWGSGASFRRTATYLANSKLYLGCDTGLAHLGEAVGTCAITTFGPTVPEMGFGPWRAKSRAVGASLWCRPCGKDGRFCFRPSRRYLCQHLLTPHDVLVAMGVRALPENPPEEATWVASRALKKTALGRFYLFLLRRVLWGFILPRKVSRHRIDSRFGPTSLGERPGATGARCWFHAASAGELESLWTVILKASQEFDEVLITGFSESVGERLEKLNATLAKSGRPARWVGYSPYEGEWYGALAVVKPSLFVTAKYEAWPELWVSLAELNIPLAIVGAQSRRSLKLAKLACRVIGGRVPALHLLTSRQEDGLPLSQLFPGAHVRSVGDPRWDRVQQRAAIGSTRARELVSLFRDWPRPWGVLAQIWEEDLEVWSAELKRLKGTLWVVPHRIDEPHLATLEDLLVKAGLKTLRTSGLRGSVPIAPRPGMVVLGDEIGFLSELYASVDWAYVGGGFSAGVHSTIEPAIHGIPLSCGPKNVDQFPEISELARTGQLKVISDAQQAQDWHLSALSLATDSANGPSEAWKQQALSRLGATDRVMQALAEAAKTVVP